MICILTGPVRSGKTTALQQWAENRNDVYGILTPDIDQRRFFLNTHTKEVFNMEAGNGEEAVSIGRFRFSKKNFENACNIIRDGAGTMGWLVIDEIGPLELREEGFATVLKQVLLQRTDKIILVVRDSLIDEVKKAFDLKNCVLISSSQLVSLTS